MFGGRDGGTDPSIPPTKDQKYFWEQMGVTHCVSQPTPGQQLLPLASPGHRQPARTPERGCRRSRRDCRARGSGVPFSPSLDELRAAGRGGPRSAAQRSPGAASRSRSAAHGAPHGAAVRSRGAAVPVTPEGTRRPLCGGLGGCPSPAHCAAEPPSGLRVYRLVLLLREPPSPESEAPGEQLLLLLLPGGIPRGPSRSQAGGRAGAMGSTYSLSHDRVSVC